MPGWFVEFYDEDGNLDHNAVVHSFEELMDLCQGRAFKVQTRAYDNKETDNDD